MDMEKFNSINGLRTIACIGIVLMHISQNTNYQIDSYLYNTIISSFTQFVYLFMMISSFGMCCGYYEKVKNGKIVPNEFYKKRLKKIFPFFAVLVLFEVIWNHSMISTAEGFADLTLMFGLVSNYEISVIGVGWFIGVVFLFYMVFPYFTFLLDNKRRAWFVLIISILLNFLCVGLFDVNRHNFLFGFVYFVLGGIIYLYKDKLKEIISRKKYIFLIIAIITTIMYYVTPSIKYIDTIKLLILFATWMIYAIGTEGRILNNRLTAFISGISMEIYLSHMVVFRIIEKIHLLSITNVDILNYCIVSIITLTAVIIFDLVIKKGLEMIKDTFNKKIIKV